MGNIRTSGGVGRGWERERVGERGWNRGDRGRLGSEEKGGGGDRVG